MISLGILYGGRSGEHDVSLCSAASIVSGLDKNKYSITAIGIARNGKWYVQDEPVIVEHESFGKILRLEEKGNWKLNHFPSDGRLTLVDNDTGRSVSVDVVFPAVHGTFCEDGTLQGLLELASVPYVGADVVGSSVGMDKDVAKRLLRDSGIPVVPWETITSSSWQHDRETLSQKVINNIGFPLFVKPCCAGSSVGISKVKKKEELNDAIDFGLKFDNKVLVEKGLEVREIESSVLGNDQPEVSCLGEVIPNHEFYSYDAKYIDSNGAQLVIPAKLDANLEKQIQDWAIKVFLALNCSGMARIDFFVEKKTNSVYLNEINTLPGFTSISMYPKLWAESNLPYNKLLDKLIELAFERYAAKKRISAVL